MLLKQRVAGFVILLLAFSSFSVLSQAKTPSFSKNLFVKIGSEQWVEEKLREYPELLWLADSQYSLIPLNIPESREKHRLCFSLDLFNKQSPEFDEAIRSLAYLNLILDGSKTAYNSLLSLQEGAVLPFKQFISIHKYFKQLSASLSIQSGKEQSVRFFESAVIFRRIGNSLKARQIFQPYFREDNESVFRKKAFQVLNRFPELAPSYARLSEHLKTYLQQVGHIIDYPNVFNLTESFFAWEKLNLVNDPVLASVDLSLYFLSACGQFGCDAVFYKDFSSFIQANRLLKDYGAKVAYYYYLSSKAKSFGFDPTNKIDEALTRIAVLVGCEEKSSDGIFLKEGFSKLSELEAKVFIAHCFHADTPKKLNMKGLSDLIKSLSSRLVIEDNNRKEVIASTLKIFSQTLLTYNDMKTKNLLETDTELHFEDALSSYNEIDLNHKEFSIRIHANGQVNLIV